MGREAAESGKTDSDCDGVGNTTSKSPKDVPRRIFANYSPEDISVVLCEGTKGRS